VGGVPLAEHAVFPVSDVAIVPALGIPTWVKSFFPLVKNLLDVPHDVYLPFRFSGQ
jgi:hypothetical protein